MAKLYAYVGPPAIREAVLGVPSGISVVSADALRMWAAGQEEWDDDGLTVTFVLLPDGTLRVAPRRSEHVACALGGDVLAAGEMTVCLAPQLAVVRVTNQSTGYCPQPECWQATRATLNALAIPCPDELSQAFTFRCCVACGARNLVKDAWFVCDLCGHDLPLEWNFAKCRESAS